MNKLTLGSLLGVCLIALLPAKTMAAVDFTPKPASPATIAQQKSAKASLPRETGQDEEFANRGFIAAPKQSRIVNKNGEIVWDFEVLDWVQGKAPDTVNPGLWRQMKLVNKRGLYKVTDNIWQVRGFDIANMLVIKGDTGWIIVDPLMSTETAAVALDFVNQHLGERPVSAVIYGHSHADHFGGVRAVITPGTEPPIYAPKDTLKEVVSETVLAGNAMARRLALHMGEVLPANPRGTIGNGLVARLPAHGTISIIPPTNEIRKTGESHVIDGVTFEFQMTPETEAPAEMNFYLPEYKTLYISENATCALHNIQTPRGALVRDANQWAWFLTELINFYGDKAENLVTGHCWPRFGNDAIKKYLTLQRDNYKFIHDQTVRRMNNGETPLEIAENLKRPESLSGQWSNHDFYGTLKHNSKGVYQRYIGWWDGNPAHLDQLPPEQMGKRYLKFLGGAEKIINEAKRAMEQGDYRWSAELLNHLVFAEPDNEQAKSLLADTYEQLGYQAESGTWRNYYLTGAAELRSAKRLSWNAGSPDVVKAMSTQSLLDLISVRLNPDKISNRSYTFEIDDGGNGNDALLTLSNGVLVGEAGKSIENPSVSVSGSRQNLMGLFLGKLALEKVKQQGLIVKGNEQVLIELLNALDSPPNDFAIVTP